MTIRPPAFEFHNGRTARNANDLLFILTEGPADLWSDHVVLGANARNDFASWAEYGLQEKALAMRLREATSREATLKTIKHWLEPQIERNASFHGHSAKDFFIGLACGIIIGIIITQLVLL